MVQFDPGPPPEVSDHFERVPQPMHPTAISSGTTGDRSSIVGGWTGQPGCSASPPIRPNRTDSRPNRWSGTRANASKVSSASSA